ncbi:MULTISPECIES: intercompartmental signaling factor BofC [Bacillus]|uniref:intercompartmental signaling factor BofC n=1 Tax=Bacillus TaxID=1386 RepID=UPI00047C89D4|nr:MULTISPECIES: intercompartmental signaling factor BofC [Bacillus]QHZ49155.1 signaling peptide protein [Bacillus sp. NSP9.1]WFA07519.1 intercompartmental signaling factor BofC [Bacillus sp. HSf4]
MFSFQQEAAGRSASEAKEQDRVHIQFEKVYLDGDVGIENKEEPLGKVEDVKAAYKGWQLVDQKKGFMLFRKQVDDISPLSKTNGYIGVTEDGVISTFHGRPGVLSEPIQSFFQIDIKRLESRMADDLRKGIPYRTKHEFQHVIEAVKSSGIMKDMKT